MIEVQQASGTTYLDDIQFYEANVSPLSIDDQLRFEYNPTNAVKTISLEAKYIGVDSTVYNGTVTLQPFTSIVLLKSGAVQQTLTVDAGKDISLILPANNTILKGTAYGTVASYQWTKVAGPDLVVIATPNNPSTQISNLIAGKYTFKLKVIDNNGDSVSAFVNVTASGVLPVTLVSFDGKITDKKIALEWMVSSEVNVNKYAIERSSDGQTFENIGQVISSNLADVQSNYGFADNSPMSGINYYRLVMIDKDGDFKYSKNYFLQHVKH